MAEKKFFVDINLQGNKLVNPVVGSNSSMTTAGSFQYNAGRLEYYNGTTVQEVANLNDIAAVTGGLILQGGYDAATNTPDIAADASVLKGFFWVVTAAGSFLGEAVQVGDSIIAKQDNPGATAANWLILQGNVVIATDSVDGISRLATQAEADAGTEGGAVVITPATLQGKIDAQVTPEINNKLPLAGGTMSGAIDMDSNNLENANAVRTDEVSNRAGDVGLIWDNDNANFFGIGQVKGLTSAPTAGTDAANKAYVDNQDALKVSKSGDNMLGNLDMDGNSVTNLSTPTDGGDAANKTYVDDNTNNKLPLAGGTMSGNLDMGGLTINNIGTVVTNELTSPTVNGIDVYTQLNMSAGNTITNLPAPTNDGDAANKQYVDDQDSLKLSKAGDTMSGNLNMGANEINNASLVQTNRVDTDYLSSKSNPGNAPIVSYDNLEFDTGKTIINLPAPTNGGDATNKTYVDNAASTAESNANDYTDDAIAQEVTDRNAAIASKTYTQFISTSDWVLSDGLYSLDVIHGLQGFPVISAIESASGNYCEMQYKYLIDGTTKISSNILPSETIIVSFVNTLN